ncbi:WYL domain-containing protein, partial [Amycolatopsis thailandensis]
AGVPVYPQPGRGGGWSLIGGARTDLSGLSASEAQALFLLAGPAASISPEVKSALRKLVRALPETFRADARAAADAVVVDPSGWGEREKERPEPLTVLQAGVVRRRKVRFRYAKKGAEPVERVVDPWGLVDKDDVWYLIAGTEKGQRTFRADRMSEVTVTDLPAGRPDDFELSRAWEQVVDQVEQHRSGLDATVLIAERHLPILQDHFGRQAHVEETLDDGRVRVTVSAPVAWMIAQQLAGWGSMIDVLGPPSVQEELARIGAELVERYATPVR